MASQCIDCVPGLSYPVHVPTVHVNWVETYQWPAVIQVTTCTTLRITWWFCSSGKILAWGRAHKIYWFYLIMLCHIWVAKCTGMGPIKNSWKFGCTILMPFLQFTPCYYRVISHVADVLIVVNDLLYTGSSTCRFCVWQSTLNLKSPLSSHFLYPYNLASMSLWIQSNVNQASTECWSFLDVCIWGMAYAYSTI